MKQKFENTESFLDFFSFLFHYQVHSVYTLRQLLCTLIEARTSDFWLNPDFLMWNLNSNQWLLNNKTYLVNCAIKTHCDGYYYFRYVIVKGKPWNWFCLHIPRESSIYLYFQLTWVFLKVPNFVWGLNFDQCSNGTS